jgi:hypothetical protein
MVKLSLDRPYTVHARSMDRSGDGSTPSRYKLILRDPIRCDDDKYMVATLVSATVPSSFYLVDARNRTLTLRFNQPDFPEYAKYADIAVTAALSGKTTRADYARTVNVTLKQGNYSIEELMAEIKTKCNAACATAHASEAFRTFKRSASGTLFDEDTSDAGEASSTTAHVVSQPAFGFTYDKALNKIRLHRTDSGGKMLLGQFQLRTNSTKLIHALGFTHVTALTLKQLGLSSSVRTSDTISWHYRMVGSSGSTETEYNGFEIATASTTDTSYGNAVYSANCVNVYANDSVFLHIVNFPANAFTTLAQASSTVLGVIPMYAGAGSETFHAPSEPTSCNIGSMLVSEIDVRLTDAEGLEIDFQGLEHEFQLRFQVYEKGTGAHFRPPDTSFRERNAAHQFANVHAAAMERAAAPRRGF